MTFTLDKRLLDGSIEVANWPLSTVLFKNEANYIWFLLIPRRNDVTEIAHLKLEDQQELTRETNKLSRIILDNFNSDKLNISAIGNVVPQLHIHVVGRFKDDPLWPESIWQRAYKAQPYDENSLMTQLDKIKLLFTAQ